LKVLLDGFALKMKIAKISYDDAAKLLGVEPTTWTDEQSLSSALEAFLIKTVTDAGSQDDAACSKATRAVELLSQTGLDEAALRKVVEQTQSDSRIRPTMQAAVLTGLAASAETSVWFRDHLLNLARMAGNRWVRLAALEVLAKHCSNLETARDLCRDILTDNGRAARIGQDIAPMLGERVGRQEWLRETLAEIAGNKEAGALRFGAILTLGRIWGSEPWLQELLIGIASDNGEVSNWEDDPNVRGTALETLCGLWISEPWLIELLVGIATNGCDDADLRRLALTMLTQPERGDGVDFGTLIGIIGNKVEYSPVRCHAIEVSAGRWGKETWLTQALSGIIGDGTDDSSVRMKAVEALLKVLGPQEWLVEALRQIPDSRGGIMLQKDRILRTINAS